MLDDSNAAERNFFLTYVPIVSITSVPDKDAAELSLSILDYGCSCTNNCTAKFSKQDLPNSHYQCCGLNLYCKDHVNHLNLVLQGIVSSVPNNITLWLLCLGVFNALVHCGSTTSAKNHKVANRKETYTGFYFHGMPLCKKLFQFAFAVGLKKLKNIKNWIRNGVQAAVHQNVTVIPNVRSLSWEQLMKGVTFISHFALAHALVLPGRLPTYRVNMDLMLLPSAMNKIYMFNK